MPPKTDWEEVRFAVCAENMGVDPQTTRARYLDLRNDYEGIGRFYHTWKHIQASLQELEICEAESVIHEIYELEWAIYFHDCIYSVYYPDLNEELSARKAVAGIKPELQGRVQKLILYTLPGAYAFIEYSDGRYMMDAGNGLSYRGTVWRGAAGSGED